MGLTQGCCGPVPLTAQAIQATPYASSLSSEPSSESFQSKNWQKNDPEKQKVYF